MVMFGGHVFQQSWTYSHEADYMQELLMENEKKLGQSFNFILCYMDDVLSTNKFGDLC